MHLFWIGLSSFAISAVVSFLLSSMYLWWVRRDG